jgi:exopolysaccharide biosynthesis polyprenyl glycosylphosphotransferase
MTTTFPIRTENLSAPPELARNVGFPGVHRATRALGGVAAVLRPSAVWDAAALLVLVPFLLGATPLSGADVVVAMITVVPCWLFLLAVSRTFTGASETVGSAVGAGLVRRLVQAGLCFAAVLPVLLSTTGLPADPVRILATATLATVGAVAHRRIAHAASRRSAARVGTKVRVVVSGHGRAVERVLAELASDSGSTFEVVQVCAPGVAGLEHADLPATAQELGAEAVVVVPCRHQDPLSLRRLGWRLETTGVRLLVATGLHDVSPARATMEYAGAMPLVRVRPAALESRRMKLKAGADRALGLLAVIALAPLMLAVALVIVAESSGPALFRQTRVGKDGTPFTIFKFRTMKAGAELEQAALTAAFSGSVLFKLPVDPRVTRVGRVLRRYSLDELPQLFNVVRGDMSMVGPRPALPGEVERYESDTRRRLAVKPGITGLWQVSGRSDLCWEEAVRLDLRYVDNWSLGGDLRIVGRTFGAVLSHRGAY